jgi:hypothetical protein
MHTHEMLATYCEDGDGDPDESSEEANSEPDLPEKHKGIKLVLLYGLNIDSNTRAERTQRYLSLKNICIQEMYPLCVCFPSNMK